MLWKSIRLPVSSSQTPRRLPIGRIGVSDSHSNSTSILRRERLSTMATSYPCAERCSEVGQPQKPSPPRTSTFITRAPFLLYARSIFFFGVRPNSHRTCQPTIVADKSTKEYQTGANALFHSSRGPARRIRGSGLGTVLATYRLAYPAEAILTQINISSPLWVK